MRVTEAEIHRLVRYWRKQLDLEGWVIHVRFTETGRLVASCKARPAYEYAIVNFNLPRLRADLFERVELEEVVVHELVHCVSWKASERAVTQLSRALLRAAGRW